MSDKTYGPYQYRKDGDPLTTCPECGGDLTAPDGIDIELVVGGHVVTVPSCLDDDGTLFDTDDGSVAKGLHGSTHCGHCGEMLINLEGVEEWDEEGKVYQAPAKPGARLPGSVESVEDVIAFAEAHGKDSDPDHEVGDLQEVCRMLWEWLSEEQKALALPELREYVRETMGYEIDRLP